MKELLFDLKSKDAAGRIGRLSIDGKTIETPTLMPVFNPNKPILSIKELASCGMRALMTNAYIFLKSEELREKVESKGLHKFLGFDGVVATDSGSYQLMVYGAVDVENKDIVEFENKIGSDIGSFLDIPTPPDAYKPRVEKQLQVTLERATEAKKNANFVVNAGVQGGVFLDLRAEAAKALGEQFNLIAVGGIVPLMESYRFAELVDVIATVKQNIPLNRPVHAFGLGHPMVFPIAVALGCDLFDSAAYALYAKAGRYLTSHGTKHLDELDYLPCSCPVCSKHGLDLKQLPDEEKIRELARHNLFVSFEELARVKQAIKEGSLWELVATRCRSHPMLLNGLKSMLKHSKWISELDAITKKSAFFPTGFESAKRSDAINALERIPRVSSENTFTLPPFGEVPVEILQLHPFNSTLGSGGTESSKIPQARDIEKIRASADYQFGAGAGELIPENARLRRSRESKRVRYVYEGKELLCVVRARDSFLIPKQKLAEKLHEKFKSPKLRLVLQDDEEVLKCVKEGKSVFAKFVSKVDPNLRAGDECLIVDSKDNLIRVGTLVLSPKEIIAFERGMAASVR